MAEREHDRMPYAVQVEFRTASSFLVAYSVNLSRGGLFLETDRGHPDRRADRRSPARCPAPAPITLIGVVAWRRGRGQPPMARPASAIEFQDVGAAARRR